MSAPVAVVTGANRGIGLEVTLQLAQLGHFVYLGSRELESGRRAANQLRDEGLEVLPIQLDVTLPTDLETAADAVRETHGRIDAVVNNAAINYDSGTRGIDPDLGLVRETLETNVYGAWNTMLAFLPLLRKSDHGRIVNVSSGAGALIDMGGGVPAYRVSKVSLNALTRIWSAELRADGILVNSVCPGWVATDMGGSGGRPVADGAAGIVWAATLPDDGPTGGFFRDEKPIAW